MPHAMPIEDKLWEMRLNGKDNIVRSIYFLAYNKKNSRNSSFAHFYKKDSGHPRKAIEIAKLRMKEV